MTSPGPSGPSPEKIIPIFAAALHGETLSGSPLASITVSQPSPSTTLEHLLQKLNLVYTARP